MPLLYVTADSIGETSGGGIVTANELQALKDFSTYATLQLRDPFVSRVGILSRDQLNSQAAEPWKWDQKAREAVGGENAKFRLCHIYSGTWPTLVPYLKEKGCKVVITIAAHDKDISKEEHEKLGWPFPFPHLTEPKQWSKYIEGYRQADVIVCPGKVPAQTVRNYGPEFRNKDIRIIPHGCHLPEKVAPLPKNFVVGYMGSFGADKGIRYLLEAWKKLDYKDGSLLMLAGRDSGTPLARHLLNQCGGGNVHLAGWQDDVSKFYNSISLYVQPSATEGFGIEVLEAMAHGRPVLCSDGAGAVDLREDIKIRARDVDCLMLYIDTCKKRQEQLPSLGMSDRKVAENYTWDKIRAQYQQLWKEVLGWN